MNLYYNILVLAFASFLLLFAQAQSPCNPPSNEDVLSTVLPHLNQSTLSLDHILPIRDVGSGARPYVLLRDIFPIDDALLTSSLTPDCKTIGESEIALYNIANELGGIPVGYDAEYDGLLYHNIVPTPGKTDSQSSQGSQNEFKPHSDGGFLPDSLSPDFLALAGLRNKKNVETYIYPVDDVIPKLSKKTIDVLSSPLFVITAPETFKFKNSNYTHLLNSPPAPLLYRCPYNLQQWCIRMSEMTALTPQADGAMKVLMDALYSVRKSVVIKPGDVLLFQNHRVLHGRSAFTPDFNGTDRWLRRLYISLRSHLTRLGVDVRNKSHVVFATQDVLPYLRRPDLYNLASNTTYAVLPAPERMIEVVHDKSNQQNAGVILSKQLLRRTAA